MGGKRGMHWSFLRGLKRLSQGHYIAISSSLNHLYLPATILVSLVAQPLDTTVKVWDQGVVGMAELAYGKEVSPV